jgi:L-asparagine transporter-like permease
VSNLDLLRNNKKLAKMKLLIPFYCISKVVLIFFICLFLTLLNTATTYWGVYLGLILAFLFVLILVAIIIKRQPEDCSYDSFKVKESVFRFLSWSYSI